jgi:toxin-antitoxin system PIN domain toxin
VFVVDTSVLLYAANEDCAEHAACRALVERCRRQPLPWYVSWSILYEFVGAATHRAVWPTPWTAEEAWAFVDALLASPGLAVLAPTERHARVAAQTLAEIPGLEGNVFQEAKTAILMREHGVRRIYTRDVDFHRFPFLEILDPLT